MARRWTGSVTGVTRLPTLESDADASAAIASVVVLTVGGRDAALRALDGSLGEGPFEKILVVNALSTEEVQPWMELAGWKVVPAGKNLGVPGGRNLGVASASADVVVFLDDDAVSETAGLVEACVGCFQDDPKLGAVGFRIVVPESGETLQRWNPRLRLRPEVSGPVTAFPGGGAAVSRRAFNAVGGFCDAFFYALEETDLCWRLLDADWEVQYDHRLVISHPKTEVTRHVGAMKQTARNRVWLARRQLPLPVGVVYTVAWGLRTVLRDRSREAAVSWWDGTRSGLVSMAGERKPMRWRTIWKMTRRGRPPIF